MADDQNSSSNFKVVDRRSFSSDGKRISADEQTAEPGAPAREEPPAASHAASATVSKAPPQDSREFEMLVSYLSTTAMFQLGLIAGPDGERLAPDPMSARQTIGFLEALQKKTRGNLTPNESRLIEEVMYELRMSCVEIEKRAVPKHK